MSATGPIDVSSSTSAALVAGERRARVLEYLSKAASALDGVTDELHAARLSSEDREAIAPSIEAVTVALGRLENATSMPSRMGAR
jgi:hypothetical protein